MSWIVMFHEYTDNESTYTQFEVLFSMQDNIFKNHMEVYDNVGKLCIL